MSEPQIIQCSASFKKVPAQFLLFKLHLMNFNGKTTLLAGGFFGKKTAFTVTQTKDYSKTMKGYLFCFSSFS